MGNILSSLSRQGRKLKNRLRGKKHEPDRAGANAAGERVDSSGSLLELEPRIVASGHDGEESGTSTDGPRVRSMDRIQPEPMPAGRSDKVPQRREVNINRKEIGQRHSRLDPDSEVAVDSRPSREVERVYPSPSTPSIPPIGEPDST